MPKTSSTPPFDRYGLAAGLCVGGGLLSIYWTSFSVPMLLDDKASLADNVSIRSLWPIWSALSPPDDAGVGGRPLLNFTYAVNYALGGKSVWGYHALNLLIHFLAACVLFALVRRIFRSPILVGRLGAASNPLALAVAAIWAWHPVQTEAVTYLTQRGESLMGLFFLLTLYFSARAAAPQGGAAGRLWVALSALCCLAGMATKEVMVTAPVVVLLADRTFFAMSFREALKRRWPLYGALAATWIPLGALMVHVHERSVGFSYGIGAWTNALTETRAVLHYIGLAVWPKTLIFDYGADAGIWAAVLEEVWPQALVLATLLSATVLALRRFPAVGFASAWFFVILSPTSSFVPLTGQPIAEHRLYLPLAGVAALVVAAGYALAGRRAYPVFALIALVLAFSAAGRNRDYATEERLWSDTVAKCPDESRPHINLGVVLSYKPGRLGDAIAQFQAALRLRPDSADAHNNLGNAWLKTPGHTEDAMAEFKEALRLKPEFAAAHNDLGNALSALPGHSAEATAEYEQAVKLNPNWAEAHNNLGEAYAKLPGRANDAIREYGRALSLEPESAEAHNNLGNALTQVGGRGPEAIAHYEAALRLQPDFAEAQYNLASVLSQTPGRLSEAINHYEAAIAIRPDYVEAEYNLGNAWFQMQGHPSDAVLHLERALRLKPQFPEAHNNLGYIESRMPGRLDAAINEFREAIRQRPDFADAHYNLARALLESPGREAEARSELRTYLNLRPGNRSALRMLEELQGAPP